MPTYQGGGGLFQPGRQKRGGIQVTFDAAKMIRLANQARGESTRIGRAVEVAHEQLALELSKHIAEVLKDKVDARGRVQGMRRSGRGGRKSQQDRLGNAIVSPKNRRVNQQGYTVGYLDTIQAVAPYYRGLELGTSKHVGRYLSGVFLGDGVAKTRNGATKGVMVQGGRSGRFTQSNTDKPWHTDDSKPYFPGVKIQRRIIGYRYFEGGQRAFIARGGTTHRAMSTYAIAFKKEGMDLLARRLSNTAGLPSRSTYVDTGF